MNLCELPGPVRCLIVGCDAKYGFIRWLLSDGHLEDALSAYGASQYEAGEGAYAQSVHGGRD